MPPYGWILTLAACAGTAIGGVPVGHDAIAFRPAELIEGGLDISDVGLSSGVMVFGAAGYDGEPGSLNNTGIAWVYRLTGDWGEPQVLLPEDPDTNDYFGGEVACLDSWVFVRNGHEYGGYYNSIDVFQYQFGGGGWVRTQQLTPAAGGGSIDFGSSIAADQSLGQRLIVGAKKENDEGSDDAGAAFVFRKEGQTWIEEAKLVASDARPDEWFGRAVAISDDVAAVTSHGGYFADSDRPGSVYVFRRVGTEWFEEVQLSPLTILTGHQFGTSVAIDGDVLAVGAPAPYAGSTEGRVWIYEYDGAGWAPFLLESPEANGHFGISVAVEDGLVAVGAKNTDAGGTLYFYRRDRSGWVEVARHEAGSGENTDIAQGIAIAQGRVLASSDIDIDDPNSGGALLFEDADLDGILEYDDCPELGLDDPMDCNGNMVNDACELRRGVASDCDGNGILDWCDMYGGDVDRDNNGWHDACDIANGLLADCDGDLVPDTYQSPRPRCGVDALTLTPIPDADPAAVVSQVVTMSGDGLDNGIVAALIGSGNDSRVLLWKDGGDTPIGEPIRILNSTRCMSDAVLAKWGDTPRLVASGRHLLVAGGEGVVPLHLHGSGDHLSLRHDFSCGSESTGPSDPNEDEDPEPWGVAEDSEFPVILRVQDNTRAAVCFVHHAIGGSLSGPNASVTTRTGIGDGSGGYPGINLTDPLPEDVGQPWVSDLDGDCNEDLLIPQGEDGTLRICMGAAVDDGDTNDPNEDGFPGGMVWGDIHVLSHDAWQNVQFVLAGALGDGLMHIIVIEEDGEIWQIPPGEGELLGEPVYVTTVEGTVESAALIDLVGWHVPELAVLYRDNNGVMQLKIMPGGPEFPTFVDESIDITPETEPISMTGGSIPDGDGITRGVLILSDGTDVVRIAGVGEGCLADIDRDGQVHVSDLLNMLEHWGQTGGHADLVRPGPVNLDDIILLLNDWHADCS